MPFLGKVSIELNPRRIQGCCTRVRAFKVLALEEGVMALIGKKKPKKMEDSYKWLHYLDVRN